MTIPIIGRPDKIDLFELVRLALDRGYVVAIRPDGREFARVQLAPVALRGVGLDAVVPIAEVPRAIKEGLEAIQAHIDTFAKGSRLLKD